MNKVINHNKHTMTSPSKEAKMEDRLTDLPDSILCHILSFLPTQEAVQTVLLRRFGTLWTFLPNLNFDDNDFESFWPGDENFNTTFFQFVHNVLALHQQPTIERFRVNIGTMLYQEIKSEHWRQEIDSWLNFALGKQVKVLQFEFGMVEAVEEIYKLPFTEFVSSSIVDLKLFNIDMKLPIRVQLSSLRVLKLEFIDVSNETFREIIQCCPLLKRMKISYCSSLTEVNSPDLEVLKIERFGIIYEELMKINCPKLSSFDYEGGLDGLEIVNISSVVHVTVGYLCIAEEQFNHFTHFQSVLNKLLDAKTITLSSEFIEAMIESEKSELDIHNQEEYCWSSLKNIVIHNISMSSYTVMVQLIEILLKSSPVLDQLVIYYAKDKTSEPSECSMTSEQFSELSAKLPTFTKTSKTAIVLLQ